MSTALTRILRFARLTTWLVLVAMLGSLSAPAVLAADAGAKTTETAADASDEAAEGDEAESDDGEDEARASGDVLFRGTPRTDRTQLNRTLGTIVGALGIGLLGLSFGPIGFFLGAALGGGLGYIISRELFDDYRPRYEGSMFTDPYYDSYYGPGSRLTPLPSVSAGGTGYTVPEGSSLRELQEVYFGALDDYREALRGGEVNEIDSTRQAYLDAYQALIRARATAR